MSQDTKNGGVQTRRETLAKDGENTVGQYPNVTSPINQKDRFGVEAIVPQHHSTTRTPSLYSVLQSGLWQAYTTRRLLGGEG